MRLAIPLTALLLIGWIAGGSWYYGQQCCGNKTTAAPVAAAAKDAAGAKAVDAVKAVKPKAVLTIPPLNIKDGTTFSAKAPDNLTFLKSKVPADVPSSTLNTFRKIGQYLKNNPNKELVLTGAYGFDEDNPSSFPNLGEARANNIKGQLTKMGVLDKQVKVKGKANRNIEFVDNKMAGGIDFAFNTNTPPPPPKPPKKETKAASLSMSDGKDFSLSLDENVVFSKSSYEFDKPMSPKVGEAYKKVATYLSKNPKRGIKLTGLYSKEEKNTSLLPNLGLARANNIKVELEKLGIKNRQIVTAAQLKNDLAFANNKLKGGVEYSFIAAAADNNAAEKEKLEKLAKELKAKERRLYFETGATSLNISEELRKYFADLIYYLDKTPTAKVDVTGHTDNVGDAAKNIKYGQGRADFIKAYMVKNGLKSKQIVTASKGQTKPIAPNTTPEGKAKNRRVDIKLK